MKTAVKYFLNKKEEEKPKMRDIHRAFLEAVLEAERMKKSLRIMKYRRFN